MGVNLPSQPASSIILFSLLPKPRRLCKYVHTIMPRVVSESQLRLRDAPLQVSTELVSGEQGKARQHLPPADRERYPLSLALYHLSPRHRPSSQALVELACDHRYSISERETHTRPARFGFWLWFWARDFFRSTPMCAYTIRNPLCMYRPQANGLPLPPPHLCTDALLLGDLCIRLGLVGCGGSGGGGGYQYSNVCWAKKHYVCST